ncbi:MAG: hypothetical protein EOO23_06570 [Comamonadaceae bacterium]|nr:MAG: hypothetical protein EOO23_06570 [Comamonadaceae bacterium]
MQDAASATSVDLPDPIRAALAPFAPAQSSVHKGGYQYGGQAYPRLIDADTVRLNDERALALQIASSPEQWI